MNKATESLREHDADVIRNVKREVKIARAEVDEGESITFYFHSLDSDGSFARKLAGSEALARLLVKEIIDMGIDEADIDMDAEKIRIRL